jgi:hypothetical protein
MFETPMDIRILKLLANLGLAIACLSQSILLVGRIHRPWLWIIAGVIGYLIQNAIAYAVFDVMMALSNEYRGTLQLILPYAILGLALAGAQACIMAYWRLGGLSWFVLTFGSVWLGFVALLIVDRALLTFMMEQSNANEAIRGVLKMLALWITYGAITGWALWRRLHGNERRIAAVA